MTKAELIKALQDSPTPDDWQVKILKNQWIPGLQPSTELFEITQVSVFDEGELTIEFSCEDLPNDQDA